MRLILTFVLLPILSLSAAAQAFVHPGGLHTKDDLDRMKSKVAAKADPWFTAWNKFVDDPKAQAGYKARPAKDMGSRQRAQDDATAMYYNALRWYISGDETHAECAVRIANDWANTVSARPYGDDLSGIPIGSFALAAELLRVYPGWSEADFGKFKRMMVDHWYPKSSDFLKNHRGGPVDRCWANWDACNMLAVLGIGVLCDDRAKFEEAVAYFKTGKGMGSIDNAVPFVYPGGLGQWQEAGRDFAHTMGGQGLLAEFCQTAWNQGLDLFGTDDNKLLKGGEYAAQYTLWQGVPYTAYNNSDQARNFYISTNYKGRLAASHFELLYNHYTVRKGLKSPNVQRFAALRRPEPGEIDIFGYGTLTFTLDAGDSPLTVSPPSVPREVTAVPGIGRVELKWSPSGAYSAHGYEVFRATTPGGPYKSIYSTNNWTTPGFTDTEVEAGKTYHYTIAALNNAGKSNPTAPVSAVPAIGGPLPSVCQPVSSKDATYSEAAGRSFLVQGDGGDIDGNFAGLPVEGDFNLTARLVEWKGPVGLMGLTVRGQSTGKPTTLAVTLGEIGGRQARFRSRAGNDKVEVQRGNDYTWLPIWFRLQRSGDLFTGWQSPDGIEWFEVGRSTVALPRTALAGLLVSAGGNPPGTKKEDVPRGLFDHVRLSDEPPAPPVAPASLKSNATDGVVTLDWQNPADDTRDGFKVEASLDGAPFYEIADLVAGASRFENTGVRNPYSLRYRVRAYNTGGYSAYSNITP
jgi:hypothetical protein